MPAKIKNCGLSTPEAIDQSVATGASFVGFVHYPASPRHLTVEQMASLHAHTPASVKRVNVLVNPDDALLRRLPKPDFWQVHDVLDPSRIAAIEAMTGIPVITGIRVRGTADIDLAASLESVSAHLLFDAYVPHDKGGSGQVFDWNLLGHRRLQKPWFLAGGLTPENVAIAIRTTRAQMVDVSSGIEDAPGRKSLEKIAAFNAAVLGSA